MTNNKINPVNGVCNDKCTPEEKIRDLEKEVFKLRKKIMELEQELAKPKDDRFLYSKSWETLNRNDKILYLICTTFVDTQENRSVLKKNQWKDDKNTFVFSKTNYEKYGLSQFLVDASFKRLKEHGFIDTISSEERGGQYNKRILYKFSDKWQIKENETKEARERLERIWKIMCSTGAYKGEGITKKKIAEEIGVYETKVNNWWRFPSYETANKIQKAFKKLLNIYLYESEELYVDNNQEEIDTEEEDYMTNFYEETYEKIKESE